ncbi:hypothetical protein AB835_02950 [Candidatus Endobugula sertula]|uniref:CheW-like domain-containing protein n=1 Tax=Candidatus Endobugula sertula TaxID=62101 RepID=A0A1D2QSN5_9GAMM|nr:hypothetical protein AB835_02950 [Candidatus Endobugula sertula]
MNVDEVPSLLVPITDRRLLLPMVSIAETLPYKQPQEPKKIEGCKWYLGDILWRGIMVPMISYEAINGDAIADIKGVTQMVVLNNTGVHPKLPFICFPTQGIPRLSRVTNDSIVEDQMIVPKAFDQMNVHVAGEPAAIPNISKLEQAYVQLMSL